MLRHLEFYSLEEVKTGNVFKKKERFFWEGEESGLFSSSLRRRTLHPTLDFVILRGSRNSPNFVILRGSGKSPHFAILRESGKSPQFVILRESGGSSARMRFLPAMSAVTRQGATAPLDSRLRGSDGCLVLRFGILRAGGHNKIWWEK